ncbi:putative F420-dependent oxidoreductase domain protein [Mycolicibacterium hassiacum DSM 44199]|uniref:Putative F420-dependent oxidoreductase domain protein n=1 Tax=Mycolicibacterium hassiacum (strain DSM 44199 / CIP 105218 / JCM 12690 / 3849) TaxID=1122247 RepID=K5BCL7_MYCHD|nr:LLM class F420-dependent oxidoreductase [Mycolicibacterium hassiacum]EKF21662.1 putative F420-dependent oxidoreductase domain protein [Mycolicibacterium hassiacum DSM 44199]MBX5488513.1 LLM class F420-dependent oxidoreductase [Mycolicibacterium hassiacum]PZN25370.1 MAG: LLM class F420-dependent oxidoreductase [Mycolicibacterium hassiacum]VCT91257.1 F420-dependent hydroxymycolic acid dehydrogenase [Mycolicibacterium hassiacum DSM 44199]
MKWGIVFSSTGFPDPDAAVALAVAAEEAGFESLWAPEHVVMSRHPDATPYRGSPDGKMDRLARRGGIPDPLIWFGYVAAVTKRIRFGTGVLILPEHQPVVLAKSAATLDHLSGGRLMLGVGVGELPEEYAAVGMTFTDRGKRMDEYIDAIRELWRNDVASFDGRYVKFDQVECRPWPVRRDIPLFIGGSSRAAIRRAALRGDGYFPFVFPGQDPEVELPRLIARVRAETAAAGRDPDAMEFTAGGARTVEAAKRYADFGIHRLTVAIRARTIPEMRDEVARLGDELVGPTADL